MNQHCLVIFYPQDDDADKRKLVNKTYIVASKDAGLKTVQYAKWDGQHFIGEFGRVKSVQWWGNFPTHPDDSKNKRW